MTLHGEPMSESAEAMLARIGQDVMHLTDKIEDVRKSVDGVRSEIRDSANNYTQLKTENARLDERIRALEKECDESKTHRTKTDERLASLQQRMWTFAGAVTTLAAVASFVVEILFKH